MRNLDIVVRKPDFNEFVVSGHLQDFLMRKFAEVIVDQSESFDYNVDADNWYNRLKDWSTTYSGIEVIPRGALLSGQDLLQHNIKLDDQSSLLAALMVIKSGAASDVDLKIQDSSPLLDDYTTLDYNSNDLESIATKILYNIIDDVYNNLQFTFKVGPNNNQPIKQLSDASRIFRAELNKQFKIYNVGIGLMETAARLARLDFSIDDAVIKFMQKYDVDVIVDNSPLTQWMKNTNVAVLGARKDLGEVYGEEFKEKFLKDIKRLKDYQKHQQLVVDTLNRIYLKMPALQLRGYFNSDIETIRREGTTIQDDNTYILTPMNAIQFIDVNLVTKTDERIQGYSVFDDIDNTDLKMYGATEDDLSNMIPLFRNTLSKRISEFQSCRYRAIESLHQSEEFTFNYKVTKFFSSETIAAIFAEIEEIKREIKFVFKSKFLLPSEQVKDVDGELNVYITDDPEIVAKYVNYEELANGNRTLEFKITSTMPTPAREFSVQNGVYTNTSFTDALKTELEYAKDYKVLLRKPTMKLRNIVDFGDIKPDSHVKLDTFEDLFKNLEIIHDPDTSLYKLLDDTRYQQFKVKKDTFFDFMNVENLSHRLTYTDYVNRVTAPVRDWLIKNAGYNILSMKILSAPVRQSDGYKLACFYLINEILRFFNLHFTKEEIEFIEPASLNTQIGVI